MCEFRNTPIGRFLEGHHGDGSDAPNCTIDVRVRCLADFCDESIELVIVDRDTGEDLTEPVGLDCTGADRRYSLPVRIADALTARNVVMRFHCCDRDRDGQEDRIWVRCE